MLLISHNLRRPGLVLIRMSTSPSSSFTPAATEPVIASPVTCFVEFKIEALLLSVQCAISTHFAFI